jgi:hypothetical protein
VPRRTERRNEKTVRGGRRRDAVPAQRVSKGNHRASRWRSAPVAAVIPRVTFIISTAASIRGSFVIHTVMNISSRECGWIPAAEERYEVVSAPRGHACRLSSFPLLRAQIGRCFFGHFTPPLLPALAELQTLACAASRREDRATSVPRTPAAA